MLVTQCRDVFRKSLRKIKNLASSDIFACTILNYQCFQTSRNCSDLGYSCKIMV